MQPINLAGAPLPTPKLDYQIVFVLGGPGSGKGTQVRPLLADPLLQWYATEALGQGVGWAFTHLGEAGLSRGSAPSSWRSLGWCTSARATCCGRT